MSCSIISKLWQEGFLHNRNEADGQVDIYSINVPLVPSLLEDDASRPEARLTEMATTRYQRLFAHVRDGDSRSQELKKAGPDAASESSDSGNVSTSSYAPRLGEKMQFKFQVSQRFNVTQQGFPTFCDSSRTLDSSFIPTLNRFLTGRTFMPYSRAIFL